MEKLQITIVLEYDLASHYGTDVYLEMEAADLADDLEDTAYDDLMDLMRGDRLRFWAEVQKKCARCGAEVIFENVSKGYFGYCPNHDEDLFEFETDTTNNERELTK